MMSLVLLVLVVAVIAGIISRLPIPEPFKTIVYGLLVILVLVRAWPFLTAAVGG